MSEMEEPQPREQMGAEREACDTGRLLLEDNPEYAGAHFAAPERILGREEPGYAR